MTPAGDMRLLRVAGRDVYAYDVLPSTNDEAAARARAGAAEGSAVWALRQTAGRGRRGREWRSDDGNLFVSTIFRPQVAPARAAELSFAAALAVADALETPAFGGLRPQLKWPNDVLLGGGKVAGILLESELADDGGVAWVVVGVGVNLAVAPGDVERPAAALPAAVDRETALEALLSALDRRCRQWRTGGFAAIRNDWLEKAVGLEQPIIVRLAKETLHGVFRGLDSDGVLLLDVGDGLPPRRIAAGDVFFEGEA